VRPRVGFARAQARAQAGQTRQRCRGRAAATALQNKGDAPWTSAASFVIRTALTGFDKPLALIVFLLFATGIVALYSAAIDMPGRVEDQLRNILLSYVVMMVIAYMPTQLLMRIAVPLYRGVAADCGGDVRLIRKGARRWLNVGMVIQPSEIMKISMPLMLAWYFQKREGVIKWFDFVVALIIWACRWA
jgi:rod shape determining protein RodA